VFGPCFEKNPSLVHVREVYGHWSLFGKCLVLAREEPFIGPCKGSVWSLVENNPALVLVGKVFGPYWGRTLHWSLLGLALGRALHWSLFGMYLVCFGKNPSLVLVVEVFGPYFGKNFSSVLVGEMFGLCLGKNHSLVLVQEVFSPWSLLEKCLVLGPCWRSVWSLLGETTSMVLVRGDHFFGPCSRSVWSSFVKKPSLVLVGEVFGPWSLFGKCLVLVREEPFIGFC